MSFLVKNAKTYEPVQIGMPVPEAWLERAEWGQKTSPTKIYAALPGEDISQASGERKLVIARGGEMIFDNGEIPLECDASGNVTRSRRDVYLPTDSSGQPTGQSIRDRQYRLIAKGVEVARLPGSNGGETEARDYGIYLPLCSPKVVLRLGRPIYITDAFGPGDHQWTDEPVLKIAEKNGQWVVAGALNGPEFDHTWTALGLLRSTPMAAAQQRADAALTQSEKSYRLTKVFNFLRSLPCRVIHGHWRHRADVSTQPK